MNNGHADEAFRRNILRRLLVRADNRASLRHALAAAEVAGGPAASEWLVREADAVLNDVPDAVVTVITSAALDGTATALVPVVRRALVSRTGKSWRVVRGAVLRRVGREHRSAWATLADEIDQARKRPGPVLKRFGSAVIRFCRTPTP